MPRRSPHPQRRFLPLSADHTFLVLAGLLVATFVMGGASRADVQSLALLRPLACLAAAAGLIGLDRATLRAWRVPFLLLGGLALLMVAQLVPLPPSLWTQLPDREAIRQLDSAVGLADAWRPITLSPMRTLNSLASLVVPFAVLVLFCQLGDAHRRQILLLLVALAVTGGVLGLAQVMAGGGSNFHFYAVTHRGEAVGLFANRNHHAVFMSAAMLVALHLAMDRRRAEWDLTSILCVAAAALFFLSAVTSVSRAGLISAGVALPLIALVLPAGAQRSGNETGPSWLDRRWVRTGLFALPALGVFILVALEERSPALARLLAGDALEGGRAKILPEILRMARDFQPFGTGFGAFEQAYRMREPAALMEPNYFNHAHNDWVQLAIEGGVGGVALLALALAAMMLRFTRLVRGRDGADAISRSRAWLGLAVLVVAGFASFVDYPLRTPALMAVGTIAFCLFIGPILERNQRSG